MKFAYQFTQGFMSMLYRRQVKELDTWLAAVRCCGIAKLERFGQGVEQDKAAVSTGLTSRTGTDKSRGRLRG